MFPSIRRYRHLVPVIGALAFLAHVHYSKAITSMRWEHHAAGGASVHAR